MVKRSKKEPKKSFSRFSIVLNSVSNRNIISQCSGTTDNWEGWLKGVGWTREWFSPRWLTHSLLFFADHRSRSSKRMKRNTKKPLRTCPYCLDVLPVLHFPSSRQLDDHLRAEHTEKIFECEMCDRVLDRALLIDHMKEHAEELGLDDSTTDGGGGRVEDNFKENRETGRRFSCTICDRSFGYKSALKQHMKSRHSTVRGYHCKECQKAFKTSSGLYNHRRLVHLPQFNFVCDECKKQFKLQHELQRHRRTVHEKVKKYFCDQCEKGFFLQDSLTRHKRTHDKETEFECDHCGFRTTQRRYLICHLNRKHPSGGGEEINGN